MLTLIIGVILSGGMVYRSLPYPRLVASEVDQSTIGEKVVSACLTSKLINGDDYHDNLIPH